MKIAILAPVAWRTPPRKYGPWEQITSNITEGMVKKGLDVTLFATQDSITAGTLDAVVEKSWEEDKDADPKILEYRHISHVMEQAHKFDLIHNQFDFMPLGYSRLIKTPMVTTVHGFSSPKILPIYQKYNTNTDYVSISNSNRHPTLDYIATVYNGIDVSQFTFNNTPEDYLLFFGRIHRDKGCAEAIEIAKQSKRKLIIAGLIQDENYYREKVEPQIDGEQIRYVGNAAPAERDTLLGNAAALLHPINFDEPFGLSVAEAMLCGTPVIAFNRGSMPELIADEQTGFLVENVAEAAERVEDITDLDRAFCRSHAEGKFSLDRMTEGYFSVYEEILGR